jgi:hypothetical protein
MFILIGLNANPLPIIAFANESPTTFKHGFRIVLITYLNYCLFAILTLLRLVRKVLSRTFSRNNTSHWLLYEKPFLMKFYATKDFMLQPLIFQTTKAKIIINNF